MKKLFQAIIMLMLYLSLFTSVIVSASDKFSDEEENWIIKHKNKTLHVGLAPYEGIDLFLYEESNYGYLQKVVDLFELETGLDFVIDADKPWGEAYAGLVSGDIEILFGANPTPERLEFMAFTDSVYHYPYVALATKSSDIYTLGDLDSNKIGFIQGDIVIDIFKEQYNNIHYTYVEYDDPETGIYGLMNDEIQGFITAETEIITESLFEYNAVGKIAELNGIYSEMTFSTLKDNQVLASILNKIIINSETEIEKVIQEAKFTYMHKILDLTDEEKAWIQNNPSIRFGAPTDYLPIDYYSVSGEYLGVAGSFINEFTQMIGLKIEAVPGTFDQLYSQMVKGEIDGLNMAKPDD